jgi:DNA-directed RNA polymerase subunit B'
VVDVYLDEKYIGKVEDAQAFVREVRVRRREGKIPASLNILYNKTFDEVYVDISRGRTRRPVIIVQDGKSKLTEDLKKRLQTGEMKWSDLIEQGVVEYLDALEEEEAFVALNEKDLTQDPSGNKPCCYLGNYNCFSPLF